MRNPSCRKCNHASRALRDCCLRLMRYALVCHLSIKRWFQMASLGVNIDHVATVRQARRTYEPDPVWAGVEAHLGGADGITVHLREDRRHIQDEDVRRLRDLTHIKLNLEMAATDE